jgi:hypothetical protein
MKTLHSYIEFINESKNIPEIKTCYHVSHKKNIDSILKNGLKINQEYYMTYGGKWANDIYGLNPIFLSLFPTETSKQKLLDVDDVIFKIDVSDYNLVVDLPSLIDFGAYISEEYNGLYWMKNIPTKLEYYQDSEGMIYFDDLLNPEHPIVEDVILLTNSCVIMENISPNNIILISQ